MHHPRVGGCFAVLAASPLTVGTPRAALMPNLARTATCAPTNVIGRFKLLKLPKQVNEPLGDGLLKVVLCTEPSPDGGLKLVQRSVARPIVSRDDMLPDRVQSV
jgi:hypothetical protein